MSAAGGIVGGVLTLTLLQATLAGSQRDGGGAVGATATLAAQVLRRVIDPAVPLIPDLRNSSPSTPTRPAVYLPPANAGQAAPPATAPALMPA